MELKGRVALVTGASGAIGGAAARALAAAGATVYALDVAREGGIALAREIGGTFLPLDVSREDQWLAVRDHALREAGRIDILVNAAGIEGNLTDLSGLNTTLEEWRRVLSINLDGTFLGARTIMPHMIERGDGALVNVSSIVAVMGTPSGLAYGASKAGVAQLSRSLALTGAQDGRRVRVNAVLPGVIRSRMTDNIIRELAGQQGISPARSEELINGAVPFKARGEPADVADMILYLASDRSRYVTGAEFRIDAGWSVINAG